MKTDGEPGRHGDRESGPRLSTPVAVELHIEELVLHGFAPGDRYRIAEAVQGQLTRLFAEHGVLPSMARGGEIAQLDGGAFEVTPGSKPEVLGAQVAQAIYASVTR